MPNIRIRLISLVLSTLVLLNAAALGVRPGAPQKAPTLESKQTPRGGTVKRVLDGDTFVLADEKRVRLIGVDTPERGEPFSDVARAIADSILTGRQVRFEHDRLRTDRYDRVLAYVFVDDLFFNELLIRRGLARVYLFRENKRYNKRLIEAQNQARREKAGIWSLPRPSDEPFYISAGGSFRFHRPLCPLARNINPRKATKFKSRDTALDKGLSPCRECRP